MIGKRMLRITYILLMLITVVSCTKRYTVDELVKNNDKAWDILETCPNKSLKQALNDENCQTAALAIAFKSAIAFSPGGEVSDLKTLFKTLRKEIQSKIKEAQMRKKELEKYMKEERRGRVEW